MHFTITVPVSFALTGRKQREHCFFVATVLGMLKIRVTDIIVLTYVTCLGLNQIKTENLIYPPTNVVLR